MPGKVPQSSLYRRLMLASSPAVFLITAASLGLAWLGVRSSGERVFDSRLRQTAMNILNNLTRGSDGTLRLEETVADQQEFSRPRSGWYWQAHQNGVVTLRSRSLGSDALPIGGGEKVSVVFNSTTLTLFTASPRNGDVFSVTVSGPKNALEESILAEIQPIALILCILFLLLTLALHFVISRALFPLDNMAISIQKLQAGNPTQLTTYGIKEIDQATGAINELLVETRALVKTNRDAAAKLAHALKTPLAQISAHLSNADKKTAQNVQSGVDGMRRQIDIHLGRLRHAKASDTGFKSWTNLKPIIADLIFAFERRDIARKIKAIIHCDENFAVPVELTDLEELMGNILDNAFRHAASTVTINAQQVAAFQSITISDDGDGFSQETMNYFQTVSVEDVSQRLEGLGLELAQAIISRSGGVLLIQNDEVKGARIHIKWPVYPA